MRLSWVRHRPSLGVHLVSFWYGFLYFFPFMFCFKPFGLIKTKLKWMKKNNNEKPKKLSQMNWKEGIFDFLIHSRNVRLAQWIIARSPWVQGSKGPRIQGFPRVQRCKDSRYPPLVLFWALNSIGFIYLFFLFGFCFRPLAFSFKFFKYIFWNFNNLIIYK